MKMYGGEEVYLHAFLNSALHGSEWSASRPGRFSSWDTAPGPHWIGSWVGPSMCLDVVVSRKIPAPYRESNSGPPAVP